MGMECALRAGGWRVYGGSLGFVDDGAGAHDERQVLQTVWCREYGDVSADG
jgi:hypothetical protein